MTATEIWTAADLVRDILIDIKGKTEGREPLSRGALGAATHHLETACGGERERRTFLRAVFGVGSSKDLTDDERSALYTWLSPVEAEDGRWVVGNPDAGPAAREVVREALLDAGQLELL